MQPSLSDMSAALLGFATEEAALRLGQTLGGLLNATLGNAVELIVAILALIKVQCKKTIVLTDSASLLSSNLRSSDPSCLICCLSSACASSSVV